jgi:hypothetical protein
MRRIVIILVLLVGLAADKAFACQCGNRPDARTAAAKWSDVVITGKVVEVESMTLEMWFLGRKTHVPVFRVVVQVDRIWKGSTDGYLVLIQGVTNCDYPYFEHGKRYLVFASLTKLGDDTGAKTAWSANRCLPTQEAKTAAGKLKQLGDGVTVNASPRRPRERENWLQRMLRAFGWERESDKH